MVLIHNNMHHNAELFKLAPWKWCGCLSLLFLTTHHESCQYIFFWPYSLDFIHMTDYSSQLIILHCYLEDKEINEFYFSWWKEEDIYMTLGNCLLNGEKTFKFIMDICILLICSIEILPIIMQNILTCDIKNLKDMNSTKIK